MKTPHPFTRGQLLDALRRNAGESVADCARTVGVTSRAMSNYLNQGTIPDKKWHGILKLYNTDAAGAEAIAAELPVLKPGVVQEEIARREREQADFDNEGRDPATRKVGEERWWLRDERFYGKGTVEEPMAAEGVKIFSPGFSLVLAVIDARTKRGMDTSKAAVVESCVANMQARNPNEDKLAYEQFSKWFDKLVEDGDVVEDVILGEESQHVVGMSVYEAILHQPVGDAREPFPLSGGKHSSSLCEYVSFENRYEVIEDLLDEGDEGKELV